MLALSLSAALLGCESEDPAQACGTRGVWEYSDATGGCSVQFECADEIARSQTCEGPVGATQACACEEAGVEVMTFSLADACGRDATEIKDRCGW